MCEATPADGPGLAGLAVGSVPETGPATANLLAPVVVNLAQRRAGQAVPSDTVHFPRPPVTAGGGAGGAVGGVGGKRGDKPVLLRAEAILREVASG